MLIDTHCHLDAPEFASDRDAVVIAARDAGVSTIVVPAVEPCNFTAVRDCCTHHPECFPAYGIHPLYVSSVSDDVFPFLSKWLTSESDGQFPPVAIGEIGLDFFIPDFDAARQEFFLLEQLKIARNLDLPVLLHARRSVDHVLKCLRRSGVRRGIVHAFNGSFQQADEFIRLGFKLGFGGAMTYDGSTRIRKLAATLPGESIVLETDAPDIPPSWLNGRRNTPSELPRIVQELSKLRETDIQEVMRSTSNNARTALHFRLAQLADTLPKATVGGL